MFIDHLDILFCKLLVQILYQFSIGRLFFSFQKITGIYNYTYTHLYTYIHIHTYTHTQLSIYLCIYKTQPSCASQSMAPSLFPASQGSGQPGFRAAPQNRNHRGPFRGSGSLQKASLLTNMLRTPVDSARSLYFFQHKTRAS